MTAKINNLVCTEFESLISQSFYVSKVEKVLWNLILNKDALDAEQQKRLFHELLPIVTVGIYLEEEAYG